MKQPPKAIWLQFFGDETSIERELRKHGDDVTWCVDQIHAADIRYVIDRRYLPRKRKKRKPSMSDTRST